MAEKADRRLRMAVVQLRDEVPRACHWPRAPPVRVGRRLSKIHFVDSSLRSWRELVPLSLADRQRPPYARLLGDGCKIPL
jgi:hypothetical protein